MFDRRSHAREQALNEFWDDLARASGAQDAAADPLDQELVETIRHLHDLSAHPPPASSRERVRRGLQASASSLSERKEHEMYALLSPRPLHTNGRVHTSPAPPSRLGSRSLSYLALAATFVIVLSGIAAAIVIRSGLFDSDDGAPAIFAPATPSPDAGGDQQTLLEITLPADIVPHTRERHVGLSHEAYGPNSHATWVPYCCDGPVIQYQLSGAITVRAEGPIQIVRADGTAEDIQANVEATVNTGDTLIILNQTGIETVNSGSTPAEILSWVFLDDPGDTFSGRTGQEGMTGQFLLDHAQDISGSLVDIPGAATVRLQRLAIEAGERVDTPSGSTMLATTLDRSGETVIRAGDGSYIKASNTTGAPTTTVYVVTLSPAEDSATVVP